MPLGEVNKMCMEQQLAIYDSNGTCTCTILPNMIVDSIKAPTHIQQPLTWSDQLTAAKQSGWGYYIIT